MEEAFLSMGATDQANEQVLSDVESGEEAIDTGQGSEEGIEANLKEADEEVQAKLKEYDQKLEKSIKNMDAEKRKQKLEEMMKKYKK